MPRSLRIPKDPSNREDSPATRYVYLRILRILFFVYFFLLFSFLFLFLYMYTYLGMDGQEEAACCPGTRPGWPLPRIGAAGRLFLAIHPSQMSYTLPAFLNNFNGLAWFGMHPPSEKIKERKKNKKKIKGKQKKI